MFPSFFQLLSYVNHVFYRQQNVEMKPEVIMLSSQRKRQFHYGYSARGRFVERHTVSFQKQKKNTNLQNSKNKKKTLDYIVFIYIIFFCFIFHFSILIVLIIISSRCPWCPLHNRYMKT